MLVKGVDAAGQLTVGEKHVMTGVSCMAVTVGWRRRAF
jgi:hypothetical protein